MIDITEMNINDNKNIILKYLTVIMFYLCWNLCFTNALIGFSYLLLHLCLCLCLFYAMHSTHIVGYVKLHLCFELLM